MFVPAAPAVQEQLHNLIANMLTTVYQMGSALAAAQRTLRAKSSHLQMSPLGRKVKCGIAVFRTPPVHVLISSSRR